MADDEALPSKAHRPKLSGPKAGKKKNKSDENKSSNDKRHNAKAFTFHSVVKAAKQFRRAKDIETKKHHVPVVDRTPLEPPPVIVAVVGPPKVGKTTLINSLLKNFTRQNLSNIQGPVTLVSGKKRRITLIECGNDINSMIDIAKIADLVLLLIDASFGFEMEVFEFLNICQVHGFPKIMGVLTHLDMLKNNKSLKKIKKKLKDRFWTEVYQGAKLFYLSGLVHGSYPKVEVHNLGRFISVMKFRPLTWRTAHPYILADRMEDLTDPEKVRQDPKCDRKVSLYGYVRGAHLKYNTKVHLLGCGDYQLDDLSLLRDPCPLPDKEKKRTLNEKERLVYAPMSGVGGIVYDKDAVYIDLGGSHSVKPDSEQQSNEDEETDKPHNELVSTLMDTKHTLDSKMASSHMTLFKDGISVSTEEFNEHNDNRPSQQLVQSEDGRIRRKAIFNGNDDSDEDDDDSDNDDDKMLVDESNIDDEPIDNEDNDSDGDDDDNDSDGDDDNDSDGDDDNDSDGADDSDAQGVDDDTNNPKSSLHQKTAMKRKALDDEPEAEDSEDDCVKQKSKSKKSKKEAAKTDQNDSSTKTKKRTKIVHEKETDSDEDIMIKSNAKQNKKSKQGKSQDNITITERTKYDKLSRKAEISPKEHDTSESDSSSDSNDDDHVNELDEDDSDGDDDDNGLIDEQVDDENDIGYASNSDGADSEDDNEEDMPSDAENSMLKWKENIVQKASEAFYKHQQSTPNLRKLVYGNAVLRTSPEGDQSDDDEDETIGGFFKVKTNREQDNVMQKRDCSLEREGSLDLDDVIANIADCFVTGKWNKDEDAETLLKQDDMLSDDEDIFGDFEDLETGETHSAKNGPDKMDDEDQDDNSDENEEKLEQKKMSRIEKKKKLKAAFNSQYDEGDEASFYEELKAQMSEQSQLNQREFEDMDDETRVQYEGFRPGMYVRIELKNMPCEFVTNFDARYPIILGGVLSNEDALGYIQARVKKHRWFKRILKTRDPLILSIGWRRFQSLVMYSMQDHNGRHRMLKYTPEHLHCTASFYGPIAPPNTGLLAIQTVAGTTSDFRISATGTVLALDKSIELVKKLKLTGTPTKIFKNTAFIKGMFNSALEVAKFEGASIRSVSGIRGQIKRAIKKPEGAFRATFEDKLLISDIVFVKTWYPVNIPKFYNPVTSLLLPNEAKMAWEGMKTVGQLRKAEGTKAPVKQDSIYKPIERQTRHFNPLVIPDKLQKKLPFKSKSKDLKKRKRPTMEAKRAVVLEPQEKKVYSLMQQLYTVHKEKVRKRKEKMEEKRKIYRAEVAKIDTKRQQKRKEERKKVFRMMAQAEKRKKKS